MFDMHVDHLDSGNLREVLDLTVPYCAEWEHIGIKLDIAIYSLKATKRNCMNVGGVKDCLIEMLSEWLQHDKPKPTRSALKGALEAVLGMQLNVSVYMYYAGPRSQ